MGIVRYRNAGEADAEALAALFEETFRETFGHLYRPADLAAFLRSHTAERWREQLHDPTIAVHIAEDRGVAVGLAKLGALDLPVEPDAPALGLRQLYVARQVRGAGVAAALMAWVLEEARRRGAEELYLSVYIDNARARRFYARHGFIDVGSCEFMVGDHADEDVIMKASLA